MAARLEALAKYYEQHGFSREAGELQQKAREYRQGGMPDEFPREVSVIDHRNIRFASPDKPLKLRREPGYSLETHPIEVPQVGDVVLSFYREESSLPQELGIVGATLSNGKLVEGNFRSMSRKKGMHELAIEVLEGQATIDVPSGQTLYCRMEIDGFDKAFETPLRVRWGDDPGSRVSHDYWYGVAPEDTDVYRILASPKDTEFLSKLSFSFYSKSGVTSSS